MSVTLRVLFGRHGISCANLQKSTASAPSLDPRRKFYSDPELCHSGRVAVDKLRPAFLKKVKGEKLVVCASGLIRAQQTAYGLTHTNTIYITPHICEHGMGYDDTPLPKSKQATILKEVCDEELISRRNFDYYNSTYTSNFTKFKTWFAQHWSYLSKNKSSLFLFISHGGFIRSFLKTLPGGPNLSEMKNCEIHELSFTIDTEKEVVTNVKYIGKFEYADIPDIDLSLDCALDTCRKPSCLHWNARQVPATKRCTVLKVRKTRKTLRKKTAEGRRDDVSI